MANYECISRTNYFRVTDEVRYKELFDNLISESDDVFDFTKLKEDVVYHGFGSYGSVDYEEGIDEDGYPVLNFDLFLSELQKILPEKEAFMFFESGHEKLRYITEYVTICTKNEILTLSLENIAISKAKELLGDDFTTETCC